MATSTVARGRTIAAFSLAALLGAPACHRKSPNGAGTSASASAAAAVPAAPGVPHGSEWRAFNTTTVGVFQPLKGLPSAADLARFPLDGDGLPANLTLPIDWTQDPYSSRAWSMRLNAWQFMPQILLGYDTTRQPPLLRLGIDLALDWIGRSSHSTANKEAFAWYDMAVASRAAVLGYLVRAGDNAGLLKAEERAVLVESAVAHGDWLASSKHYRRRHNHGLFSDAGLLMMCFQLDRLPQCQEWRDLARERFRKNLGSTVSASGVHLEHSPSYHFLIVRLLEQRLVADGDPESQQTLERMREAGPWLVQPNGRLPQLGDTYDDQAPPWAIDRAAKLTGARFFEDAGYYVVKTEDAQLFVAGAHHSKVHKHDDDLSFVLSDAKRRVFVDSGFLSYDRSPERVFLESAPAHNVFLVDDAYAKPAKLPSNSLRASGAAEGWYAVAGDDTHLDPSLQHERVWLYRPGRVLLIVDRFQGDANAHRLTRYFHLAPDLKTTASARGAKLAQGEFQAELFDASAAPTTVAIAKGLRKSPFQGIVSEHEDVLLDAPVVAFRTPSSKRASATLLSVVELGARSRRDEYRVLESTPGRLELLVAGQRLHVVRSGSELTVRIEPATH
jgi:hypothetical protein